MPSLNSERQWRWACVVLSAALTLLVGRNVLGGGKTFVPTDFLTTRAPWGSKDQTDAYVQNRLHQDILEFNTTHAFVAARELREGRMPLWNPEILCGVPSVGDPQLGTFYPLRLLSLRYLPPALALDLFILVHFFFSGMAMFALLRSMGVGGPGAIGGALTWMLCGQQMVWFKYGSGLVAAVFLPWMALALHRGFQKRSLPWLGGAGALWGVLFLGSHPQLSFLALVWAAIQFVGNARKVGWRWWVTGSALFSLVGVGVGAIQLFPFLDALLGSSKTIFRDAFVFGRPWRRPILLGTLFWQRAFGSPLDRLDVTESWFDTNFFEFQGYMGLLPLGLACLAWNRGRMIGGTALALLAIATCLPVWWVAKTLIPGLWFLRPERLFLFAFAVSVLAGLGLDEALNHSPPRRLGMTGMVAAGAVLVVGLLGAARQATWISVVNPAYVALTIASAGAAISGFLLTTSASKALKAAVAIGAILVDLLPGFLAYNGSYDPLPGEPASIAALPKGERSLVTLESDYFRFGFRNYLMLYGRSTPEGYASLFPKPYAELARAWGGGVGERSVKFNSHSTRALEALNVRAVLGPEGPSRISCLPRAYLAQNLEVLPDAEARLKRLADPQFDPARSVILEAKVELVPDPKARVDPLGPNAWRIAARSASVLVISDTFDAGWQCEIDGTDSAVLRANHAFRAISVPAGEHVVRLHYLPSTVRYGFWLSLITLGALTLGGVWLGFRRARPREGNPTSQGP